MPTLIDNLNLINSYKSDIKSAIENKGVDMTGVSFGSYADKIGEIQTSTPFVTETLRVSSNGVYTPSSGVDGFSLVDVSVNAPDGDGTWSRPYGLMDAISVINDNPTGTSSMYVRAFVTQINSAYSQTGTYGNAYFYVGPINSYNYNWLSAYRLLYFDGKNYNSYPDYASRPDIQIGDEVIMYGAFRIYNNKPQTIQGQTYLYALNGIYGVEPVPNTELLVEDNGNYDVTYYTNIAVGIDQGYTQKDITENNVYIGYLVNSASFVASSVFTNNSTVEFVSLSNCTSIYSMAFNGCSNLKFAYAPNCEYIGSFAFSGCINLSYITAPDCSYIGESAFQNCYSLSEANFPLVTGLLYNTFSNCSSLTTVNIESCSYIQREVFNQCYNLQSISLPVCNNIGSSAFRKCSAIQTLDLPVCSYIGEQAFAYCSSLSVVHLSAVTTISAEAFRLDPIEEIFIYTSQVCSLNVTGFYQTPIASGTGLIFVPASLVDAYKSATNWSTYASQIFSIPE